MSNYFSRTDSLGTIACEVKTTSAEDTEITYEFCQLSDNIVSRCDIGEEIISEETEKAFYKKMLK
jgi:hypothetical protein